MRWRWSSRCAETGNARWAIARVGHRLGMNTATLRNWVQKAKVDFVQRPGTASDDKKRIAEQEREVRELRWARDPEGGECSFRPGAWQRRPVVSGAARSGGILPEGDDVEAEGLELSLGVTGLAAAVGVPDVPVIRDHGGDHGLPFST